MRCKLTASIVTTTTYLCILTGPFALCRNLSIWELIHCSRIAFNDDTIFHLNSDEQRRCFLQMSTSLVASLRDYLCATSSTTETYTWDNISFHSTTPLDGNHFWHRKFISCKTDFNTYPLSLSFNSSLIS